MRRNLFLRPFNRGVSRAIGYALLVLAALAVLDHFRGSLVADAGAAFPPPPTLRGLSPVVEGPWIADPRECDLVAGISADCVFMD